MQPLTFGEQQKQQVTAQTHTSYTYPVTKIDAQTPYGATGAAADQPDALEPLLAGLFCAQCCCLSVLVCVSASHARMPCMSFARLMLS